MEGLFLLPMPHAKGRGGTDTARACLRDYSPAAAHWKPIPRDEWDSLPDEQRQDYLVMGILSLLDCEAGEDEREEEQELLEQAWEDPHNIPEVLGALRAYRLDHLIWRYPQAPQRA